MHVCGDSVGGCSHEQISEQHRLQPAHCMSGQNHFPPRVEASLLSNIACSPLTVCRGRITSLPEWKPAF
eukprot:364902-Chlamydomonas_euryale.AAC.28